MTWVTVIDLGDLDNLGNPYWKCSRVVMTEWAAYVSNKTRPIDSEYKGLYWKCIHCIQQSNQITGN